MGDFLKRMAIDSVRRVGNARRLRSEGELHQMLQSVATPARLSLSREGFDLIAEFKRSAPSSRSLTGSSQRNSPIEYASSCQRAGVAAISVVTEPNEFDGSLEQLTEIATATNVPVMRKDFLVDPYQLLEARVAGASGVLLILKLLDRHQLEDMFAAAAEFDLFVLLEAFDKEDLDRIEAAIFDAARLGVVVLAGVNCRNLRSLRISPVRFERLAQHLPRDALLVAESGLATLADVRSVAALGYSLALVGSALMQTPAPGQLVTNMIHAGRLETRKLCAYA